MYGVDIKNMDNYDLVLDTSFVPPEKVADTVLKYYRMAREGKKFDKYVLSPKRSTRFLRKRTARSPSRSGTAISFSWRGKRSFCPL